MEEVKGKSAMRLFGKGMKESFLGSYHNYMIELLRLVLVAIGYSFTYRENLKM